MKKWEVLTIIGLVLAISLGITVLVINEDLEPDAGIPTITNYEDCVAAGYPIMESYPEQCAVPGGESFTRQLSIDEKNKLDESMRPLDTP